MSKPERDEVGASHLPPPRTAATPTLDDAVQMLRLLGWLATLGSVVAVVALLMPTLAVDGNPWPPVLVLLACTAGAYAALLFGVAAALPQRRPWARVAGIGCACLVLAGFPVGTAIGAYLLWFLLFRWPPERSGLDGDPVP